MPAKVAQSQIWNRPPAAKQGVDAVDRALSILKAFGDGDRCLSLTAIAAKTGLYKSTILRLAASLENGRLLVRGEDGLYRLGPETSRLGALYRQSFDLGELIRPVLKQLAEQTQETASFYTREGRHRICLYRENSPRAVRHHLEEGTRLPLDRGAAGRVLIAFGGDDSESSRAIRSDGHYVSLGERDPEVAAAAVPVSDAAGTLRGALAISALIGRFGDDAQRKAIKALKESAATLSPGLPAAD